MAYTKIKPIKSEAHLQSAVNYITREDKTDGKTNIYTHMCNIENAVLHFRNVREKAIKKGNNVAHHICLSFSPEDKINPEKAIEIGQELMKEIYPNNQYILSVHNDREHLHCHILVNAVDMEKHKKINSNRYTLQEMRNISDNICEKYGLSVITLQYKNHRQKLKSAIDNAVENSNSFEEFLMNMKSKRYEIKNGKYLAFKGITDKIFIRCDSLGTAYKEKNLRDRIVNKTVAENKDKKNYDDKFAMRTKRSILKESIDEAIKQSRSFDEFLSKMRDLDYDLKQGKYLAFKRKDGNRFIRVKSVGEDYTEEMIKFRIENAEEYKEILERREKGRINKLIVKENVYSSRYINSTNINTNIKVLNYLAENNIKDYSELIIKIEKSKQREASNEKSLNEINIKISKIKDTINALNTYERYKYIAKEYKTIYDKDNYKIKYRKQLMAYEVAEIILETAKKSGEQLSARELNSQLNNFEEAKKSAEKIKIQIKENLKNLENIKYNLEIFDKKLSDKEQEKQINNFQRKSNYCRR